MGPCRRRLSRSSQLMDWKNGWALTRLAPPLRLPRRRERSTVQKERTMSLACSDMGGSWGNVRGLPMILVKIEGQHLDVIAPRPPTEFIFSSSFRFSSLMSSHYPLFNVLSLQFCFFSLLLSRFCDSALSGHVNLLFVNLNRILMPKRRIPRKEFIYQNP